MLPGVAAAGTVPRFPSVLMRSFPALIVVTPSYVLPPENVTLLAPSFVIPNVSGPSVITALIASPVPAELTVESPSNVTPPVDSVPKPAEFAIVPPLIVTGLATVAPLMMSSVLAPTTIVPVPAVPVAPLTASVPPVIVVSPA